MNAKLVRSAALAAAVMFLGGGVWLAGPGTASAGGAPGAAAHHCAAPRRATGHVSLDQVSSRSRVPVAVILDFAFRCAGYRGGGWGYRMARYLNRGDLRAPLPKGTDYWIPVL